MAEFDWFQRQDSSESSDAQQPDDALDWAKQAYARLKAQQEAENQLPLFLQLNQHRSLPLPLTQRQNLSNRLRLPSFLTLQQPLNRFRNPWRRFQSLRQSRSQNHNLSPNRLLHRRRLGLKPRRHAGKNDLSSWWRTNHPLNPSLSWFRSVSLRLNPSWVSLMRISSGLLRCWPRKDARLIRFRWRKSTGWAACGAAWRRPARTSSPPCSTTSVMTRSEASLDDIETLLLQADVGVEATDQVLDLLRRRMNETVVDGSEAINLLKEQLRNLLDAPIKSMGANPLLAPQKGRLNIWLMVGVNGVGKTTTLGKLANLAVRSGYSCLVAAGDTFRAAAVQQLQVWADRSGVPLVANPSANADPAAVVFDAIGAAQAKDIELLLVDTAGRLQTKNNLMEELAKVRRIVDRLAPDAAVESLLVLDASQGQNGLRQAMALQKRLASLVLCSPSSMAQPAVAWRLPWPPRATCRSDSSAPVKDCAICGPSTASNLWRPCWHGLNREALASLRSPAAAPWAVRRLPIALLRRSRRRLRCVS